MVHFVPVTKIVDSGLTDIYFIGWSITDLLFITLLCITDGGVVTPLTALFFLPLVFAGIFYPLRLALIVVALTIVSYLVVGSVSGVPDTTRLPYFTAVLAMTGALCVWAARDQEHHQEDLERLSRTDPLTAASTAAASTSASGPSCRRRGATILSLALVLLDLDGFKASQRHPRPLRRRRPARLRGQPTRRRRPPRRHDRPARR